MALLSAKRIAIHLDEGQRPAVISKQDEGGPTPQNDEGLGVTRTGAETGDLSHKFLKAHDERSGLVNFEGKKRLA